MAKNDLEDLLNMWKADSEKIREDASSTSNKRRNYKEEQENRVKHLDLIIRKDDPASKTYKGFFLTAPDGGDSFRFNRIIKNLKRFGCEAKTYGTPGLMIMDPNDYVGVKDQEVKDLIVTFNNLYDEVVNIDYKKVAKGDVNRFYLQNRIKLYDMFYMYIMEGPGIEKPDLYLVTSKAIQGSTSKFAVSKESCINQEFRNATRYGANMEDVFKDIYGNETPRTRMVEFTVSRPSGYEFQMNITDVKGDAFQIPKEALDKMTPLRDQYISDRYTDPENMKKCINILRNILSDYERAEIKGKVEEEVSDVFKD